MITRVKIPQEPTLADHLMVLAGRVRAGTVDAEALIVRLQDLAVEACRAQADNDGLFDLLWLTEGETPEVLQAGQPQ